MIEKKPSLRTCKHKITLKSKQFGFNMELAFVLMYETQPLPITIMVSIIPSFSSLSMRLYLSLIFGYIYIFSVFGSHFLHIFHHRHHRYRRCPSHATHDTKLKPLSHSHTTVILQTHNHPINTIDDL